MRITKIGAAALSALALLAFSASLSSEGQPIPKTLELGKVPALIGARCSGCHDWAGSYRAIMDSGLFVPGKPAESPAWAAISEDRMPADGPLAAADKDLILAWIQAGAPAPSAGSEAPVAATPVAAGFLGFKSKEDFHRFSGWASGGILLAAGVVGAFRAYDMWSTAHAYRDSLPVPPDDYSFATCGGEVALVYNDPTGQALRWTHIGLLAAGESFYIANALTGTSFMGKLAPGWSKAKIHRYAFFLHAGLMVTEAVMGFVSSDALSRGDHGTFHALLIAHAGVGIAIPVIILSAGAIMDPGFKLR
jgi:hypothetical protein